MKSYADFLRENGAGDEEIKILDTPIARKVYEKQQADLVASAALATKAQGDLDNYNKWYTEQANPEYKRMEAAKIASDARVAQAAAIIKGATDQGLIDIAKAAGFDVDPAPAPAKKEDAVDTSKFVTHDVLLSVAQREGDAIAAAQDIAAEHGYLFGQPLRNFRQLREEAVQRKLSVEQVWMEKYKVADARTAREAKDKQEAEDRIRTSEREKVTKEFADKYGDPNQRPPSISTNILTPRPANGREKQPWDAGTDGENGSNARVIRAMKDNVRATN